MNKLRARSEALIQVSMKCFVFWDVIPCSLTFIDVSLFPFPSRYLTVLSPLGIHRTDDGKINEYGGVGQ